MAIASGATWEIRTGGADTNGGGFVTGGTDYSLQDTKRTATGSDDSKTDAVANGTTTITSATANFTTALIGNIIYLAGGTGALAAGWYQVTARTNATTITVDRTVATGTGITINIGGALASLGQLGAIWSVQTNTDHRAWVKAGAYNLASGSTNTSGGLCSVSVSGKWSLEGYNASRGDLSSTRPVFTLTGATASVTAILLSHTSASNGNRVSNLEVNCANLTGSSGIANSGTTFLCKVSNARNVGITGSATTGGISLAIACEVTGSGSASTAGTSNLTPIWCYVHDLTNAIGYQIPAGGFAAYSIADTCRGTAASRGFDMAGSSAAAYCVAYNNQGSGFFFQGNVTNGRITLLNCIAESNSAWGVDDSNASGVSQNLVLNCAFYANTSGSTSISAYSISTGALTGSGSFFTNAPSGDFSLNATAGAGAILRGAGYPTVFPGGLTTTATHVGAWQASAAGGGGASSAVPRFVNGGFVQ